MAKSNYITRQGWLVLDQELKFCGKKNAQKSPGPFQMQLRLGDRSENAEYIYGKRRLREIDRRVVFNQKIGSATNCRLQPKARGKKFSSVRGWN